MDSAFFSAAAIDVISEYPEESEYHYRQHYNCPCKVTQKPKCHESSLYL